MTIRSHLCIVMYLAMMSFIFKRIETWKRKKNVVEVELPRIVDVMDRRMNEHKEETKTSSTTTRGQNVEGDRFE